MSADINRSKALPLEMSLGITSVGASEQACICVLSDADKTFRFHTVSATGRPQRQDALEAGRHDLIADADLDVMAGLLDRGLGKVAAQILVGAERIFPHPDFHDTPTGVFAWTSATLGTLIALPTLGVLMACGCYEVPSKESMVVHHVDVPDGSGGNLKQPMMLSSGLLSACARLVLEAEPNPRQTAAVAALLARAPGAYYYWSTFNAPPSLGDVVHYRRSRQPRMRVGSHTESFSMYVKPGEESVDSIALSYALALQAHDALGPADAHKVALVTICKEFGFSLTCYSTRHDAVGVDPRRAWPLPTEYEWAIEAIRTL